MEGALVSASTGVMESVLCKLTSMLETGYRRNKRVEKDILFLRNELGSMNAVMQKHAMSKDPDLQVKAWMKEVRELAYDIEDVIDAFMAQLEEQSDHQPTGIKGFIVSSIQKLRELVSSSRIAEEIEELKHQVLEVSERRKRYKVDECTSGESAETIDPRLTALYTEIGGLVGIDAPMKKIIRLLTEANAYGEFEQQVKLVSIVGFGGMGKTTLANQVYQKIKGQFDCTCFVFMSQRPNMKKILVDLLSGLGPACNMWDDEMQIINRTRDFLHDKRFLIVIDDIWSISAWEILKCVLPDNGFGSRLITTTRIFDIATSCCSTFSGNIFRVEPLSDGDSIKLFSRRIFHSDSCPTHLEGLSKAILRKCGGLPLAILHISSLLATKSDTKDEWELVLNSIGSALENTHTLQGMKKILLLSFYDLPPHLKTCLLYLSIYPEDYMITTRGLIMRWIAEGFIAEEGGKRLDQVAQSYINDLINRSMVLPIDTIGYDGRVQRFQVHDLVLNIIKSMSVEENFVTVIDGHQKSTLPKRIRRLSLHFNDSEYVMMGSSIKSQNSVRSLTIFGFTKQVPSFSHFHAMRVLHLGYCEGLGNHNIECVCSMLQLRYLVLHSNFISKLPEEIGTLKHLQMLNVKFCSIEALPEAITKLGKLIWLYVSGVKISAGIENMQCLEELSYICLTSENTKFIEELGLLRKLRCLDITVEDPSEMEDHGRRYRESLLSSMYQLGSHSLESLSLDYRGHEDFILDSSMGSCFTPERLRKLIIEKPLSRVPVWMSTLVNLTHIELNISRMDVNDIIVLKGITSLLFLRLVFKGNAQSPRIVFDDQGFQYLKEFQIMCFISGMWPTLGPGAMPKLQRYHLTLKLREAHPKCDDFELGLKHLASLQHISVAIVPVSATDVDATVAEAAIRNETSLHPNQPILEIGTW